MKIGLLIFLLGLLALTAGINNIKTPTSRPIYYRLFPFGEISKEDDYMTSWFCLVFGPLSMISGSAYMYFSRNEKNED